MTLTCGARPVQCRTLVYWNYKILQQKVAHWGAAKHDHATPYPKQLCWLNIKQKHCFELVKLVQNIMNKKVPHWSLTLPRLSDVTLQTQASSTSTSRSGSSSSSFMCPNISRAWGQSPIQWQEIRCGTLWLTWQIQTLETILRAASRHAWVVIHSRCNVIELP